MKKLNFQRVSSHFPCPVCGRTKYCSYTEDFVICTRQYSFKQTKLGHYIHNWHEIGESPPPVPEKRGTARREDSHLDRVYRRLLSLLELEAGHRKQLLSRRLSPEGYRSLPKGSRSWICSRFDAEEMHGVPGFGKKKDGSWTLTGPPGLIAPVVSPEGLIVALNIRVDERREDGKYRLLSSSWLENGANPGARFHLAGRDKKGPLWITEGQLKADAASDFLNCPVLAVQGIASWQGAEDLQMGNTAVVAYDCEDNFETRKHENNLIRALKNSGWRVFKAYWQKNKGLDDALVEGEEIFTGRVF